MKKWYPVSQFTEQDIIRKVMIYQFTPDRIGYFRGFSNLVELLTSDVQIYKRFGRLRHTELWFFALWHFVWIPPLCDIPKGYRHSGTKE